MVEAAFSSPRSNAFPAGLRVLVVDDDPTWLKILEKMLKKCSYEVTTCCLARDALNKLRDKKDGFDIVISDVNMPDMDGFKLLEYVGLEMDLPVIMMSVDGETSRVMKGVQHGACDYLLKPIRMKELRNIWQHVVRKRKHDLRDIESLEGIESIHMTRSGLDLFDDDYLFLGEDTTSVRKRKDAESKHDDKDFSDPSSKKARVVWSVDLHQKFVKAVNQIGLDKVGPKKILDLMNVPWLTRENVASHLQKYRLYLSRLQRGNDVKDPFFGAKYTESSANTRQSDVSGGSYGFSLSNASVRGPHNKAKSSDMCFDHSLASADSCISYPSFGSTTPTHYSWTETTDVRFKQENESRDFKNCFDQLPLPEYLQPPPPICSGPSINESDVSSIISTTTSSMKGQENMNPGVGSHFAPLEEDLRFLWLHQGLEFMEYDDPTLFNEVPHHLYDTLRFDNEHLFDPTECSVIDLGLFIA